MNEKEYTVQCAIANLEAAKSRMREAHISLKAGEQKQAALVAVATADSNREIVRLQEELRRAEAETSRAQAWLIHCKANAERGFDQ